MNPPFKQPEFETDYRNTPLPATRTEAGVVRPNTGNPFDQALIRLWDPNVQPAIVQQWNFAIQEQLGNSTTLQAAYVGQKGTHLMVPMPYLQSELQSDGTITRSPYLSGNPQLANISQISGTRRTVPSVTTRFRLRCRSGSRRACSTRSLTPIRNA